MSLKKEGIPRYVPDEVDPSPEEVYRQYREMVSKGLIPEEKAIPQLSQPLDEKSQPSSQP